MFIFGRENYRDLVYKVVDLALNLIGVNLAINEILKFRPLLFYMFDREAVLPLGIPNYVKTHY